jgi:hypothetical protein
MVCRNICEIVLKDKANHIIRLARNIVEDVNDICSMKVNFVLVVVCS